MGVPLAPTKLNEVSPEVNELAARMIDLPRGVVPATAAVITAGIDLGKFLSHWIVVAWSPNATGHVVDYRRIEVASDSLGVEQARGSWMDGAEAVVMIGDHDPQKAILVFRRRHRSTARPTARMDMPHG